MKNVEISLDVIREEIIEINFYMVEALQKGDKDDVLYYKYLLDNLIKLYLKKD
jgi:hypothetical protein